MGETPKRRIIVTGAAGFLGNHFTRFALDQGVEVVGIDDLSGGYEEWLPGGDPNFSFVRGDLTDPSTIQRAFDLGYADTVYHFAAYAAEGLSPFIRVHNYNNNLVASARVINECVQRDVKVVFTSSMAVYGHQAPPFHENLERRPADPYAIAKVATELDLEVARQQHGLRYTIIRPHNVVGIRQNIWDRYRNVLGIFIRKALRGEPLVVYGDGSQVRAFSSVEFYLEPLFDVSRSFDGEIFNLGSDTFVTIGHLAEMVRTVAAHFGNDIDIRYGQPRFEVANAYCSHDKARDLLGFRDETDLRRVITEVYGWAQGEPDRTVFSHPYEITRGLYDYWQ